MSASGPLRRRAAPVLAIVLAVAMVLGGALWLQAAGDRDLGVAADPTGPSLENTELVLADLEPNGLPTQAELVSTVVARGGQTRMVEDPASTVNVAYLDRRGAPQTGDGVVLVRVGGDGVTRAVTQATFDRPLPVALHAEYTLDGVVVPPRDVVGQSGRLVVRYTITNTTAEQSTLSYVDGDGRTVRRSAPVFVPLAGVMDVLVPAGMDVAEAPRATRSTDSTGRTMLRYSLLLAPPLGTFQDEVSVVLQASEAATPQVTLALEPATSGTEPSVDLGAEALSTAAEGNTELAGGLRELGESTGELAGGAEVVADGVRALASGADALATGVAGPLTAGSRQLDQGAQQLASGAAALESGVGDAGVGAGQLAAGLAQLSDGIGDLADGLALLGSGDGLPRAVEAAERLAAAGNQIADGVGSADDPPWPDVLPDLPAIPDDVTPEQLAVIVEEYLAELAERVESVPEPTLVQSIRALEKATELLGVVTGVLVSSVEAQQAALADAKTSSLAAAAGAAGLSSELCGTTPTLSADQCDRLDEVAQQSSAAAKSATSAAASGVGQMVLARALALGVGGVGQALGLLEDAVVELSTGLRSGDRAQPGLVEGLELLESGLAESLVAVDALADGARVAQAGSAGLADGGDALVAGVDQAASGIAALSDGADALAQGTQANVAGVADLADGADELAAGAGQAARGTEGVADGVRALQVEGIDTVAAAVAEAVDDPAFAAAWVAANDARAADALPYGPPEGAVGAVAYRFTMPATADGGVPAWQWWLIAGVGAGLLAMLAVRRVRADDEG